MATVQPSKNRMLNMAWSAFKKEQRAEKKATPAEPNVDRSPNRRARNPAAPASNGPKVENGLGTPQGVGPFLEGAPRSRGAHRQVGTPDQHHVHTNPAKTAQVRADVHKKAGKVNKPAAKVKRGGSK